MKRAMTILATALLASSLFTAAASARGDVGRFGGGAHLGGFAGGAHIGSFDADQRSGGLGGGVGLRGVSAGLGELQHHAMNRFGSLRRGFSSYVGSAGDCYYPDEFSKYPPWPPYCD